MTDVVEPKLTLLSGIPGQWEGGAGLIVINGTIGGATVDLSFSDDGVNYIAIGSQFSATGYQVFAAPRNAWLKAVVAGGSPTLTLKVYREAGLHAWVQNPASSGSGGPSSDVNIASFGGASITKGQKLMAGSIPVVLASDYSISTSSADQFQLTGTIGSAAVLSNFPKTDTTGYHSFAVQFTALTAGNTAVVEQSNDGTTWTTVKDIFGAASFTAVGLYIFNISALQVRVRCSVWASGSVTIDSRFRALKAIEPLTYGAGNVDVQTQRMTLAADDPGVVSLAAILAKLNSSVAVTGTFWQTTQPVSLASVPSHAVTNAGTFAVQATEADGANVTLGAKADAKSTATDTTAVSIMSVLKQVSASVQLMVFGAGTAAAAQRTTLASDDPAVATLGAVAGAKVITDANGTLQQYLRGLVSQWIAGTLVIGTGANVIGSVGLAAETMVLGNALSAKVLINGAACKLSSYYFYNPNATATYLQLLDAATTGAVTLGTTVPKWSVCIPATSGANLAGLALNFTSGIVAAATTTATGSTAPASALDCNFGYR